MKSKKEILWTANEFGFQTGSYFFGCKKWEDKDICILEEDWKSLNVPLEYLIEKKDFKEYDEIEFISEKMNINDTIYNFIICKPKRFKSMKFATAILKSIPAHLIEKKRDRVNLFTYLIEFVEGKI